MLYFLCHIFLFYIFRVLLKSLHYLLQRLLISIWQIFDQALKMKVSLSCANRTDSLPCNLTMFILKLSEFDQVELCATFLAVFANF